MFALPEPCGGGMLYSDFTIWNLIRAIAQLDILPQQHPQFK
jgi:hypothetical protein